MTPTRKLPHWRRPGAISIPSPILLAIFIFAAIVILCFVASHAIGEAS